MAALFVGEVQAVDVDTREFSGVVFDAVTSGQEYASITWLTDAVQGRRLLGFTTSPDGARHTYWFDFTNRHNLKYKHAGCRRTPTCRFCRR